MPLDEAAKSGSEQPGALGPVRRRSRRGGRRHPRRREPRATVTPPGDAATLPVGESYQPAIEEAGHPEKPVATRSKPPAIGDAITQVNRVIEELKHALDEMEEVLETLELAERQKIDDEREIQSLQRALRQLHQPREGQSVSRR